MASSLSNKEIVLRFYKQVVGQGDMALAQALIADDYIQHSPMVKAGKEGLLESLAYFSKMPKPPTPPKPPVIRLIAEGDYVVVHMEVQMGGLPKAVLDIFKLQAGKMVEHWDAMQTQPQSSANGHSMTDGPVAIRDIAYTEQHRQIATQFFQHVYLHGQLEEIPRFVAEDLIQHQPEIPNGRQALAQSLAKVKIEELHRVIAEGNFVVMQAAGRIEEVAHVFYYIFRLHEQQIVEQWCVQQAIPAQMPHTNGMI